jgi:long-chain-fatty-acid--CoA ligase ACSBG
VVTGVYTTNTPDAVAYQLKHSQANIAVVDSDSQLQKVLQVRHKLPELKTIIQYGETGTSTEIVNWHDFKQLGKTQDTQLKRRLENQAINQPALVVYTSGTTANPKGVLLSQDNLTWLSYSCQEFYNAREGEEVGISYLPVAHVVGQVIDIWMSPIIAGTIHFADKDALRGTLVKNLERIRPTRFVGVPRVYEKMQMELEKAFGQADGAKGALLNWARGLSTKHLDSLLSGGRGHPVRYGLAEKLILGKIQARLGLDNCTGGVYSGAAPLSMESIQFMKTIGLVVNEIYGNFTYKYTDPVKHKT